MSFEESYRFLDAWLVQALRDLGIDARNAGLNDIASAAKRVDPLRSQTGLSGRHLADQCPHHDRCHRRV